MSAVEKPGPGEEPTAAARAHGSWTVRVREATVGVLPPEKLLPDGQPTYVASWIYVFGVASIASLVVTIGSGTILTLKGPGGGTTRASDTSSTASTCGRSSCSSSRWSS